MDEETAKYFSRLALITEPVKQYFIGRGLTTVEKLKNIPATDSQSLAAYLSDCPDFENLAVRRALLCMLDEIKNTVEEAKPETAFRNPQPSGPRNAKSEDISTLSSPEAGNRFSLPENPAQNEETFARRPVPAHRKKFGSRALMMRDKSKAIGHENCWYALPKIVVAKDKGFRKLTIGSNRIDKIGDKVILVVGGTGSGKSTFINAMANYLYEVKFNEPFRFQLITKEDERIESGTTKEGESKTKIVSAYELNETRLRYRLTVVDSPGFGDTEGIERDKVTLEYIRQWFERKDEHGLKTIDAVCIVIKGTETRATQEMKHNLNSVHALFNRNMTENIITVFTFCDNSKAPAVKVLSDDDLLVGDKQLFFNSYGAMDMSKDNDKMIFENYHTKCWTSFKKLFEILDELEPHSAVYTLDVLQSRKALENEALVLSEQVTQQVTNLEQLDEIIKLLQSESSRVTQRIGFTRGGATRQLTLDEVYAEYCIDHEDEDRAKSLLEHLALDLVEQEKILGDTVRSVRERLNQLNAIAMRPELATDSQYLQYLIETLSKSSSTFADYNSKINILQNHLKIVKLIETVKIGGCLFHETESVAIAYLGRTFPNLYKKLRQLGHFPTNHSGDSQDWKTANSAETDYFDDQKRLSMNSDVQLEREIDTELEELNRMIDQESLSSESVASSNPPTPLPTPRVSLWKRFSRFVIRF